MNKVYIVTQGEYSEYVICKIFSTREAAEKFYAAHDQDVTRPMNVEEYDLEDGSNIIVDTIYKAVYFKCHGYYTDYKMKYSTKPFKLKIGPDWLSDKLCGTIPVTKTITEDKEFEKIVSDVVAKYRARELL